MANFFVEGGCTMFPVSVMGLILVVASIRYALDGEPIRLRFVAALAIALAVTMVVGTWLNVASVFHYMETVKDAEFARTLMTGFMESTRPGLLGGGLLTLSLILVAIGAYRSGRRELKALRP